jgi:hypothetical protein
MFNEPHNSSISCCLSFVLQEATRKKTKKYDKKDRYGDSSATITKQINKQKQVISGFSTFGEQDASNCIAVLNGANACRQQDNGPGVLTSP